MPTTNLTATYDAGLKHNSSDETWANKRAVTSGTVEDSGADYDISVWCSGSMSNEYGILGRYGVTIPTSSMSGKTISAAELWVYVLDYDDSLKIPTIGVTGFTPASSSSYVGADIDNFADTRLNTSDLTIDYEQVNEWNTFTLNATGISYINKSGDTTFYIRLGDDISNNNPGWVAGDGEWVALDTVYANAHKTYLKVTYSDSVGGVTGKFAAGTAARFTTKT